jgi:putative membrane protein
MRASYRQRAPRDRGPASGGVSRRGDTRSLAPGSLEQEPPGGGRFDEHGDATRRTRLATERTYLAWWRTGLTAFAVSLGAGRLVPAIAGGPQALYSGVGVLFAVLGLLLIAYGRRRGREVDEAISAGRFKRADDRLLTVIAVLAAVGGLMLIALILIGR